MVSPVRSGIPPERLVEFAPSVGWLFLMVLPVVFQYQMFHVTGRSIQLIFVIAIGCAMLAADSLCYRMDRAYGAGSDDRAVHVGRILIGLCFVVPVATHLYLMPRIPLLSLFVDNHVGDRSLTQLRDESAKFLDVPSMVKYLFNWAVFIFAPIFIAVSASIGRRLQAIVGLVIGCAYALATLAKFPIVLLVLACLFALCLLPTGWQRRLVLGMVAAVLAGFLVTAVWLMSGAMDAFDGSHNQAQPAGLASMKSDDPRRAMSYGDYMRLAPMEPEHSISQMGVKNALTYVFYRALLTPADVSNRWYQYFTYVEDERLGRQFLLLEPRTAKTQTPSRLVGVWAYESRFPDKYTETVNANASFDADAFAHGGASGVALATFLLLAVRVGTAWLLRPHPIALAAYGVMLCLMAILPASASLQAIFGANGLFLIPIIVAMLFVAGRRRATLGFSGRVAASSDIADDPHSRK